MRSSRLSALAGTVAAALGVAGCGEELGPEPMRTTTVAGRVRVGGAPVGGGWVEFYPVDGTVGKLRTAPLRPDGTFEADRVAVGLNAIQVAHPTTPLRGSLGLFTRRALIRRRVDPAPAETLDIDLEQERRRLARELAQAG